MPFHRFALTLRAHIRSDPCISSLVALLTPEPQAPLDLEPPPGQMAAPQHPPEPATPALLSLMRRAASPLTVTEMSTSPIPRICDIASWWDLPLITALLIRWQH